MKKTKISLLFFSKSYDFLNIYIPKQQNQSKNTSNTYRYALKAFRAYINNEKRIATNIFQFEDCTYDFLLDYRNYLHNDKKLTEKTVNNRLAAIKSYMNYCAEDDDALKQYAFGVSRVPFYNLLESKCPIIENADALTALLSMPPNTKKGLRDKVIMAVLYDGGIRLEELTAMKIRDLDLSDEKIRIKVSEKGSRERTEILNEKTSALIRKYLSEYYAEREMDALFIYTERKGIQGAMSSRNVQKIVRKYADKVRESYELPDTVSPHTFRRTRSMLLYREGVSLEMIAEKMGCSQTRAAEAPEPVPFPDQTRESEDGRDDELSEAELLWPDDEKELSKILGF